MAAVHDRRPEQEENGGPRPPLQGSSGDDAPVGPAAGEEAAFLAEQQLEQAGSALASGSEADAESSNPLPPLDDLVQRIPAPTRELLDGLFRAKFITVKRLPKSAFKT